MGDPKDIGIQDDVLQDDLSIRDTEGAIEERAIMVALQAVGQYLVEAGLELGKDFSYAGGSLILNDLTLAHLRQKLGPEHFDHIMKMAPGLLQQKSR
ncbi:MAG: hypothetical protein AAF827_19415 [Cyanobacteria bacterium P01_D01_bin.6]